MLTVLEPWSIWTILEALFNAIEVFWIFWIFHNILEEQVYTTRSFAGAILLFVYITLLNNVSIINGTAMTFCFLGGTVLYSVSCFHGNATKKVLIGILPPAIAIVSDFVTFSISLATALFDPIKIWMPTFERFLMTFIYLLAASALYIISCHLYQKIRLLSSYPTKIMIYIIILFVFGIFAVTLLFPIASSLMAQHLAVSHLALYLVFIGLIFLLMFFSVILLLMRWAQLLQQKHDAELQTQYQHLKDEYYENMHQSLENLACFQHDFLKHTNVLKILLESEKISDAVNYLADLHDSYQNGLNVSNYTNNSVLNAIISNKRAIAEHNNITVRITAEKIDKFPFSLQDICSLFDNLFDNAIEANLKVETSRFIDLFLLQTKEDICIIMKNNYDGKATLNTKTTKSNPVIHGLGLKIVKNIVSQANGSFDQNYDQEDNMVTITIHLPKVQN